MDQDLDPPFLAIGEPVAELSPTLGWVDNMGHVPHHDSRPAQIKHHRLVRNALDAMRRTEVVDGESQGLFGVRLRGVTLNRGDVAEVDNRAIRSLDPDPSRIRSDVDLVAVTSSTDLEVVNSGPDFLDSVGVPFEDFAEREVTVGVVDFVLSVVTVKDA